MTSGTSTSPVVNPLVRDLLKDGGNVLVIGGYAGPAAEQHVRLYADLSLRKYVDIPKADVIRIVQEKDKPEQPCIVFFKASAELTYVQTATMRANEALAAAATATRCAGCGPGGDNAGTIARQAGGGGPTVDLCTWACVERLQTCIAGTDSAWRQFWCVVEYFSCRLGCMGPIIIST
jgi:hypothetical protein